MPRPSLSSFLVRCLVTTALSVCILLGVTACGTAASSGAAEQAQVDSGAGASPSAADGAASPQSTLPCVVDAILAAHCRECHGATPAFGAPMSLVTYGDLHAPSRTEPQVPVYQLAEQRVTDDSHPMPQPPNPLLDSTDLAAIASWVVAGAPPGAACDGGANPEGGSPAPPSLPCTPDTHVAPPSPWTIDASDQETYVCYGFEPNVGAKRQIVAMAPRIDNGAFLHHVTLLQADQPVSPVPAVCPLSGSTAWRPIFGWAPGGSSFELPPEAGFAEDASTHLVVQLHYVNPLAHSGTDASGFELCTTDQLRPNDADVMAFGTESISLPPGATTTETCDVQVPSYGDTTHLFAAFPHMHELGRSIDTTAFPASGGSVSLGGQAMWNFGEQGWIAISDVLDPGDVVETRCTWTNDTNRSVGFGETSADEMCFSFTMYYPKITNPEWSWALPALYSVCH